jgi:small subunit ribosomal protein S18
MQNESRRSTKDIINIEKKSNIATLTYKDVSILSNFINEQGKIIPRRVSGLKSKQQKRITKLIKQSRIAALLPFVIGKC